MAVVAVTHNITRQEDFEGSPGGTFAATDLGGGPGASAAAGLHYEGAQAASRRIAGINSERGFTYTHDDIGTVNMLAADLKIMMAKTFTALSAVINVEGNRMGIGDLVTAYYNYMVGDDGTMGDGPDFPLPPKGGYVITPIEVRVSAWMNLIPVGSPDLELIVMMRMSHNVSATTGAGTSQALDSIDYTDDGLFMVGGDSTDPDATFQSFVDADEGGGVAGTEQAGIWTANQAGILAYLNSVIGRTDAAVSTITVMTDSGFKVTFPGGFVSDGRNGLEFDLDTSGTVITLTDGSISGSDAKFGGRSLYKAYFDTELDVVGGATDQITFPLHKFRQGDQVIYSAEGGTEDIGPNATTGQAEFATAAGVAVNSTRWYVNVIDANTIELTARADLAFGTPVQEDLTPSTAGNGENHSLTRAPDTRPNLLFIGTTGTATFTRVSLTLMRIMTLTSVVTLDSCPITTCRQLVLADATLSDCIISGQTTPIGVAFLSALDAIDLDLIDGTSFTAGDEGHAIEVTTGGTLAERTAALQDVNFTGYFGGDSDNTGGVGFDPDETGNPGDVDLALDEITITTHPFVDGDPIYYSDEGGTVITGLVDQQLYYINSVDANTISLHLSREGAETDTNRVNMTAASTDAEHKFYSANAAFFNDSTADLILNITGGVSPTVRNSAGSTTTVVNTVTLTVQVDDQDGDPVEGATVRIVDTPEAQGKASLAEGTTNASGTFTAGFQYTIDTDVLTKVRLKGFKPFRALGEIKSTGLTVGVTFITDTIVDLP